MIGWRPDQLSNLQRPIRYTLVAENTHIRPSSGVRKGVPIRVARVALVRSG